MTVGSTIENMIENMMLNAFIESPRFNDYKIIKIEGISLGLDDIIDQQIKEVIEKETEARKKPTAYDAHVKAYGKFKREEDSDNIDDIMGAMRGGGQLFTNPQAFLLQNLTKLMPTLAPLLVAAALPQIIEAVIDTLTRPGFPLDPRFTRFMEQEWNTGLERQTQFNAMIGRRNVVIQTKAGWRNQMGAGHTSIYKRIAEGTGIGPRLGTLIGMPEKSTGSGGRQ